MRLGAESIRCSLAALCQEAENQVVGAPCGIMDQVAVAMGVRARVLPGPLPTGVRSMAGCRAHRARGGRVAYRCGTRRRRSPYRRAWAAAFMGKRMVERRNGRSWAWTSQLPRSAIAELPEEIEGATLPGALA